MAEEEEFDKLDTGASLTTPMQAGELRKNGYVLIKGFPCKVVETSVSKTGKHGHAKVAYTAIDIFSGRKYEDSQPSTHNVEAPNVTKREYELMNVEEDGYVSLMTEGGEPKEDLKLPTEEEHKAMVERLRKDFDDGKILTVSVIMAMGQEKIVGYREIN